MQSLLILISLVLGRVELLGLGGGVGKQFAQQSPLFHCQHAWGQYLCLLSILSDDVTSVSFQQTETIEYSSHVLIGLVGVSFRTPWLCYLLLLCPSCVLYTGRSFDLGSVFSEHWRSLHVLDCPFRHYLRRSYGSPLSWQCLSQDRHYNSFFKKKS